MTLKEFLGIGCVRSKMDVYRRKKQAAIDICVEAFDKSKRPYIALSGGKDSVAMCFVVDEAARTCGRDFRIWSHLSDASFPGTEKVCREVAERLWRPIDLDICPTSAFDALQNQQKQAFGKTGVFFDAVRKYAADKDLSFVGVRAKESKRRRRAASVHGPLFYSKSMGDVTVCHPLLYFGIEDVAAALYEYDAPIHPIYAKASLDCGVNSQGEEMFIRLSYLTSKDLLNKGTALFIKLNYPAEYAKLCKAWPEIRKYV